MKPSLSRRSAIGWLGLGATGAAWAADFPTSGAPPSGPGWFNVRDFGARGNGTALDSPALQRAIDRCFETGGGLIVIPAGAYLWGTVRLRSRVALGFLPGAMLLGSTDLAHDPAITPKFRSYTDVNYVERSLIYAEGATDIALLGPGTIHGQGEAKAFQLGGDRAAYKRRPFLIRLVEGQRVTVRDAFIHGCRPNPASAAFVRVEGARCRDVRVAAEARQPGQRLVDRRPEVPADAVNPDSP